MEVIKKVKEIEKEPTKEYASKGTTPCEVYVAINTQYHDYIELFKNWFNTNVDQKIIESAISFWFKDADSKYDNKLVSYFNEH